MIQPIRMYGAALAAGAVLLAGPARADGVAVPGAGRTGPAQAPTAPAENDITPLLVIQTARLKDLAPDPLDAGLVRAVGMLPARIEELAGEIPPLDKPTAELISDIMQAVAGPMRLVVVHDASGSPESLGYAAAVSFELESKEQAQSLHERVLGMIAEHDGPTPQAGPEGLVKIAEDGEPVVIFGPRQVGDAWRYEMHMMELVPEEAMTAGPPDAEHHGAAVAQLRVDLSALTPLVAAGRQKAGEQDQPTAVKLLDELEAAGLAGPDAITIDAAMSYQEDNSLSSAKFANLGRLWDTLSLPRGEIDRDHFKLVPADAWTARFSHFDLAFVRAIVDKLGDYGVPAEQSVEHIRQLTGIDVFADLVEPLGGEAILYRAESSGGGGVASTVLLLEVKDHDKMLATNEKLMNLTNQMVMMIPIAGRYVRVVPWEHDGQQLYSLRFPGVPVPLEPTFSYDGDWAVFGATPQACIAACDQLHGDGDGGLGTVQAFTSRLPDRGLYSISFVNADRVAHAGYGAVSVIGSGLANAARSPWDRTRDPGLVVPPYNELKAGMQPIVSWSYWDGPTLEYRCLASRSMLANLVAGLGKSGGGGLMPMAGQLMGVAARHHNGMVMNGPVLLDLAMDPVGQAIIVAAGH